MHCTSCSAPLRRPCTLGPSPSGSDQSSPNHGRSSVTPGMGFSDLVSGWHRVNNVKTVILVICTNYKFSNNKRGCCFVSITTEQLNTDGKLTTRYCLLNLFFSELFQNFTKRHFVSLLKLLALHKNQTFLLSRGKPTEWNLDLHINLYCWTPLCNPSFLCL